MLNVAAGQAGHSGWAHGHWACRSGPLVRVVMASGQVGTLGALRGWDADGAAD